MRAIGWTACLALVVIGALLWALWPARATIEAAPAPLTWTPRAPMPTARFGAGAAVGADGLIYVAGGYSADGALAALDVYNPVTDRWVTRAPMPTARAYLGFAAGHDDKLYAIGGENRTNLASAAVEAYDPATNTWSARASLPVARSGLGVWTLADGRIAAVGGDDGGGPVSRLDIYDPVANTWTSGASMPTARMCLGVVGGADGRLYAVGGLTGEEGLEDVPPALATVEVYDPAANSWSTRRPLSLGRACMGLAASGGRLFALGGIHELGDSQGATLRVEEYDPATDAWSDNTPLRRDPVFPAGVATPDGTLYVLGGSSSGKPLNPEPPLIGPTSRVEAARPAQASTPTPTPVIPEFSPFVLFGSGLLLLGALAALGRRRAGESARSPRGRLMRGLVVVAAGGAALGLALGGANAYAWLAPRGDSGHDTRYDDTAPRPQQSAQAVQSSAAYSPSVQGTGDFTHCAYPSGSSEGVRQYGAGTLFPQWVYIGDRNVRTLDGVVTFSSMYQDDSFVVHNYADINFYLVPSPPGQPLTASGNFDPRWYGVERGRLEVEIERLSGFGLPSAGDRVQVTGDHIWDCGHWANNYRSELHPIRVQVIERGSGYNVAAASDPSQVPYSTAQLPGAAQPSQAKIVDLFASSDGGYARWQLECMRTTNNPAPNCTDKARYNWYQPLAEQDYSYLVAAPPKPAGAGSLVASTADLPLINASNDFAIKQPSTTPHNQQPPARFRPQVTVIDNGGDPSQFNGIRIDLPFKSSGFDEAAAGYWYAAANRITFGWLPPANVPQARRVRVALTEFQVCRTTSPIYAPRQVPWNITADIGQNNPYLTFVQFPNRPFEYSAVYTPFWTLINPVFSGCQSYGPSDLSPSSFDNILLLPGQPLRVFLKGTQYYPFGENDPLGVVEDIWTSAQNWGIGGTYTRDFQGQTSSGSTEIHSRCQQPNPCARVTYQISASP